MKKGFVHAALCALTLAVPATAERLYVPVLGTTAADGSALATRVWVANADGIERPVAARFNDALRSGDERVVMARGGGQLLEDLAPAQKAGLIAIDADSDLGVNAWVVGREDKALAEVPVFGEREIYEAGLEVQLGDLPGRRAMASLLVGAANLSEKMAFCQANLYGGGGSLLAEVPFEVEPMSLARKDASAWAGSGRVEAVRVTCDQSFYPIAVATEKSGLTPIFATGIGPNGTCDLTLTLTQPAGSGVWIAESGAGVFHHATKANPKGIICLKAPKELKIGRAVFQWDVKVGPWSKRDKSGLHNLAYYFLDRYRSGVVGNINAAGPNKSIVKFMQNVGMPKGSNTNVKASYELVQGQTYRNVYTFDAANKMATYELLLNFVEVKRISKDTKPGNNQTLIVKPYSNGIAMVAEFGNNNGQHHPEMETWEWDYLNFRLTLFPK